MKKYIVKTAVHLRGFEDLHFFKCYCEYLKASKIKYLVYEVDDNIKVGLRGIAGVRETAEAVI